MCECGGGGREYLPFDFCDLEDFGLAVFFGLLTSFTLGCMLATSVQCDRASCVVAACPERGMVTS